MDKIVRDLEKKPLSDVDISESAECKVIPYSELQNYRTLDELLGPEGACVLLFRVSEEFGHWCCLFKHTETIARPGIEPTVEFFDSLGMYPDSELKRTPTHLKAQLGQDISLLTNLINDSPYRCIFNSYKLQTSRNDINTCVRECFFLVLFDFAGSLVYCETRSKGLGA